ncbi:Mis6-domain-containing protein [Wallemia mellicola]|uniref:Mis6-domain-containing protein n=1 Tax=Wallemia mellicola TaxID=1708541 RepID=A0AB38MVH1_9BASI|nr:hypothetical protein E3Q24_01890 [Wallemia mellicola]TIB85650.1 Mis6-domain-containing protein [Wallemia mellicola]TIB88899.1 Mis6-domain-containing protein [Wallemia mellicola]TIC24051.1 Mis6-domain-containing protein [Wallemia mellicola]TIC40948.1 Mis6-domain-containing protein [Wallemia mellicola]
MEDILLLVIKYWDIGLYQNEIFELLSFFPPRTFEETKSLSAPIDFRIRLVQCYNTIMMRWSAYDWRSMRARRSGMISVDPPSGEIIAEVPDDVNWLSVASQFVDYVENYNTKLLMEYPDNIEIKHLILDSLEASTTFVANVSEFNLRLPDISLIFELLLGGDAGITSRTSGQICYWREVMTIHNELHADGYVGPYPADFLDGFNHMVVNAVEMLYRMKGFTVSDYGEWMGIEDYSIEKIAQEVESVPWKKYKLSLRAVCDIAFSPKFIALTQRFLIELQDVMDIPKKDRYVGPLTNTAIKGSILDNPKLNIRATFLDWLAKKSVTGLPLLLFTSVNSLQYLSQQSGMGSSFYLSQSQSTKY